MNNLQSYYKNLEGLDEINADTITTESLNGISKTTLSYLDATSSIQNQINNISLTAGPQGEKGDKGDKGDTGLSFTFIENRNNSTTYSIGNVVYYSALGQSYVSIQNNNINVIPTITTFWRQIVQKGAKDHKDHKD
jgi:hypothetical protein